METTTINPVQLVTIKNKTPLFKGTEQANSIEKIELEENGFSLVAQKDLYQVGNKAVYIQPDYSLSDISLFDSFIRPGGDERKSRLGSNYRIRAVKFNLHTGDNEPVYSVGILLPIDDVMNYLWSLPKYSGYDDSEKLRKTINWVNKWFGWLSIFNRKKKVYSKSTIHVHKGFKITNNV